MGFFHNFGENVKGFYYYLEEKWYHVWDAIDEHVPVYGIIDKVDRVIPSFALFLLLLFLLIFGLGFLSIFGNLQRSDFTIALKVIDSQGEPVSGANVLISGIDLGDNAFDEITLETDSDGLVNPEIKFKEGNRISVTVTKNTATISRELLLSAENTTQEIVLPGNVNLKAAQRIDFVSSSGALISDELNLTFSCTESNFAPAPMTTIVGTVTVAANEDCGILMVSVSSNKYKPVDNRQITKVSTATTITLEEIIRQQVDAVVSVYYNGAILNESLRVSAYNENNQYVAVASSNTVSGQATIRLEEGDYIFKTTSANGYIATQSAIIEIRKNGNNTIRLNVTKNVVGTIKLSVRDSAGPLRDVYVELKKNNLMVASKTTPVGGDVNFVVTEAGAYVVGATKNGYCETIVSVDYNSTQTIVMRNSSTNVCGERLYAKVLDADNKPVAFAKVVLFKEVAGVLEKMPFEERTTNIDGNAEFGTVSYSATGETYKIFAFKSSYSGWSEAREFKATNSTQLFTATLRIPTGNVSVLVRDRDSVGVQFAEVTVMDATNGTVLSKRLIEDTNGTITFSGLKADKSVYVIIKKDGYESHTSYPKQLIGTGTIYFTIQLYKPPVQKLTTNFLGFFKNDSRVGGDGRAALRLQPGQEYDAVFEIIAPVSKNYDELGFYARVGKDEISKTEQDNVFIKEVLAPGVRDVVSGASFNPSNNRTQDNKYLNLEESKWTEITWDKANFVEGRILVAIKVKIKQNAQPDEFIELRYRAFGRTGSSNERDPLDGELNTATSNSLKDGLYAATKMAQPVGIGTEMLCEKGTTDKSFCITSSYVDTTDERGIVNYFDKSFDAKNNTPYNVSIKVMNNSTYTFDSPTVSLANPEESILINGYNISTPTNTIVRSTTGFEDYKTPLIAINGFSPNSLFQFNPVVLLPQRTGTSTLKLELVDNRRVIFETFFTMNIASDKKMVVDFLKSGEYETEPSQLIPGRADKMTLRVKNESNGLEIDDATVKIFDRFGTKLFETTTNSLGIAVLEIPASMPGEKIRMTVEKTEYESYEKEMIVSKEIVETNPVELSFTVNPQSKLEDGKQITISNKTGIDLFIKTITLTGKLKGLLNERQIESWSSAFKGLKIKAGDSEAITLKVFSGKTVPQAEDLEGEFEITLTSGLKDWVKSIKTKIRVGLGKDVDVINCLELTKTAWVSNTQGNEIEASFDVRNNCAVDGKAVQLRNLSARLEQSGNTIGTIALTSNNSAAELSTTFPRTIKAYILGQEKVPLTVRFTPYGAAFGTTEGKIIIQGENLAESKAQVISTEMTFSIAVENMQNCIVIGNDLVVIEPKAIGKFSLMNSCKTDSMFELDSELELSQKQFTLKAGESKEISINRGVQDVPGAYAVLINARQSGTKMEVLGLTKVILNPEGCFSLSRYEFDVYDSPANNSDGMDSTNLINKCKQKKVDVIVEGVIPMDWWKVAQHAIVGGIAGLVSSGGKWGWWKEDLSTTLGLDGLFGSNTNSNDPLDKIKVKDSASAAQYLATYTQLNNAWYEQSIATINGKLDPLIKDVQTARPIAQDFGTYLKQSTDSVKVLLVGPAIGVGTGVAMGSAGVIDYYISQNTTPNKVFVPSFSSNTISFPSYDLLEQNVNALYSSLNNLNSRLDALVPAIQNPKVKTTAKTELLKNIEENKKAIKGALTETDKLQNSLVTLSRANSLTDAQRAEFKKQLDDFKVTLTKLNPILTQLTKNYDDSKIVNKLTEFETKLTELKTNSAVELKNKVTANTQKIANYNGYVNANVPIPGSSTVSSVTNNSLGLSGQSKTNADSYTQIYQTTKTQNTTEQINLYNTILNTKVIPAENSLDNLVSTATISSTLTIPTNSLFLLETSAGLGNARESGTNPTMSVITSGVAGAVGGIAGAGAAGGALLAGGVYWLTNNGGTPISYNRSFNVEQVVINNSGITFESKDNSVLMQSKGSPVYDFDMLAAQGGAIINTTTQDLANAFGLTELRELIFKNIGNKVNENAYKPFVGILTVKGTEKVYNTYYDYMSIRGDVSSSIFSTADKIKMIEEKDLTVKETRNYEKKFHLLFYAWDYLDCGPGDNNPKCIPKPLANCTIGEKQGSTGPTALPKIMLNWNWNTINENTCDVANPTSIYCDSVQLMMSTIKRINSVGEFFKTNQANLTNCPSALELAGSKTQLLNENAIDVAIVGIQANSITGGARIDARVETNNNKPMSAAIKFRVMAKQVSGADVEIATAEKTVTKQFTSTETFSFEMKRGELGISQGTYNVIAEMTPTLCEGCANSDTTNDSIQVQVILGEDAIRSCGETYSTKRDYMNLILVANSASINQSTATNFLNKINFKVSLVRDGFSQDLKNDLDEALMKFTASDLIYTGGADGNLLRALFLEKFKVNTSTIDPQMGGAWKPGKYDAELIVTFNTKSWDWTYNNIKSIELNLQPWKDPEPYSPIYEVAFDGMIGLDTSNGRNGYGVGYSQMTEEGFLITNANNSNVTALTATASNPVIEARVSTNRNFNFSNSQNKGNVLSVSKSEGTVDLTLSPSVAVPLLLDITRTTGRDAYAFYSVEIANQPMEAGRTLMTWNGIGQGCVDFEGSGMVGQLLDTRASETYIGAVGTTASYGMAWANAKYSGTASYYGTLFVPQGKSARIYVSGQGDSAQLTTTNSIGQQNIFLESTPNRDFEINSLQDVFDKVSAGTVCVLDETGDYFWNTKKVLETIETQINAREDTCIKP